MITGGAAATVFYNLSQTHPTLELPLIDYDVALMFQPMLVLGISIGVSFNVIFAEWMITILLTIIFTVMATRAFLKGVETWRKETRTKKEAVQRLAIRWYRLGGEEVEPRTLAEGPSNGSGKETKDSKRAEVSILKNIYWKGVGVLVAVWVIILAFQIGKV